MAYTLLQLRQALAEEAFSGEHPIRLLTTAAGSASALTFGELAFGASGATANQYHGCWLYNTAAVPVAPFSSRVLQQAGFAPTTGVLTVAPAFGSAPGTAMEIIFCYDLHPDELHRAINRILRNLIYYAYLPITLVPDGDMERSSTSSWNQVGTVTLSKDANTVFLFGRQMLQVSLAASTEGVSSLPINTTRGEPFLVSSQIAVTTGNITVHLWDTTNNITIHSVVVSDTDSRPVEVRFTADVPATCKDVELRFISDNASGLFFLGPQTVLSQKRRRYSLNPASTDPASILSVSDIKAVFGFPAGETEAVSESYYSFSVDGKEVDVLFEEDARSLIAQNIVLPTYPTQPYFMRVQKRFPELGVTAALINAATNTTTADRDTVVQGAMHYIERARYAKVAASKPQLAAIHLGRSREYAQKFARMRQAQGYGIVAREVPQARTTVAMS